MGVCEFLVVQVQRLLLVVLIWEKVCGGTLQNLRNPAIHPLAGGLKVS